MREQLQAIQVVRAMSFVWAEAATRGSVTDNRSVLPEAALDAAISVDEKTSIQATAMKFSTPLRVALIGSALVFAAAGIYALDLPPRSPQLAEMVVIQLASGLTALFAVVVATTRLLRRQATLQRGNVIPLLVGAVPAVLLVASYLFGVYR